MWECQWEQKVRSSNDIKAFLSVLFHCVYRVQQPTTPSFATAVSNIRSGQFFLDWWSVISLFRHICVPSFLRWLPSLRTSRLDASTLVIVCFVWPDRGVTSPDQVVYLWVLLGVSGLCCLASWLGGICRTVWPSPGFIGCYSTNGASRSSRLEKVCPLPEKKEILTQPRVLLRTLQSLFWQDYC